MTVSDFEVQMAKPCLDSLCKWVREFEQMWYVMQVISGKENRTVLLLQKTVSAELLERCFVPVRRLNKKFHGKWQEITEKLFPGYVFLISEEPQLLYEALKVLPAMTKMLGKCEQYFTPLAAEDIQLLKSLQNWRQEEASTEISRVHVEAGNRIRIISGPLKQLEGQIKKVNLHKRIAVVEIEFMGNKSRIHLGIEMVERMEE